MPARGGVRLLPRSRGNRVALVVAGDLLVLRRLPAWLPKVAHWHRPHVIAPDVGGTNPLTICEVHALGAIFTAAAASVVEMVAVAFAGVAHVVLAWEVPRRRCT